tara:strand:+ start:73357 stop:75480 length:2124 start_codon:yes stop_codon:yes gene_type:complete
MITVSGLVLTFEPIHTATQKNYPTDLSELSLSDLVHQLKTNYGDLLEINVTEKEFVKVSTLGLDGDFYVNPRDGKRLSSSYERPALFQTMTNFHRSLFLKSPGRIFVGIISFLLILIALSGLLLVVKKMGWKKLFLPFEKSDSLQYYHTYLGRINLIPILIIAVSGVILSLVRFSVFDVESSTSNYINSKQTESENRTWKEFPIFQNTPLSQITKLEFPFSDDEEDYFRLYLKDKEVVIHQKSGAIIQQNDYPISKAMAILSFNLHTGTNSVVWSLVLLFACLNILYFMYSGFIISYRRLSSKTQNKMKASNAEILLLVGSENGKTQQFSKVLYQAMVQQGEKVYIDELNNYRHFPNLKELIVLTSTYGDGEAPSNGNRFLKKIDKVKPSQNIHFNVLGFGSKKYPKFCQFAKEVQQKLANKVEYTQALPPKYINKNDFKQFHKWTTDWNLKSGSSLLIPEKIRLKKRKDYRFKVVSNTKVSDQFGTTSFLELKSDKQYKIQAGDLLSIQPKKKEEERLYSIGKNAKGNLLLAIKNHPDGKVSPFLTALKAKKKFKGKHQVNPHFRLPLKAPKVIMIANGTGIAPFIGMLHDGSYSNKRELFWGVKTKAHFNTLKKEIKLCKKKEQLNQFEMALSQESCAFNYVQDIIRSRAEKIAKDLEQGAVIMLCGSLEMSQSVTTVLNEISQQFNGKELNYYKQKHQILSDCY